MPENTSYAVLTGDFVQSRKLSQSALDAARDALNAGVGHINSWGHGIVDGEMDFFRGDSWQLLLSDPSAALRVALLLRSCLLAGGHPDSRIGMGIGPVDHVTRPRISASMGPAFTRSGSSLDSLSGSCRMGLVLADSATPTARWIPMSIRFCDSVVRHWSKRQAEIVYHALHPKEPTQETIAAALNPPVSRQAVSQVLIGSHWPDLNDAVHLFAKTDWEALG